MTIIAQYAACPESIEIQSKSSRQKVNKSPPMINRLRLMTTSAPMMKLIICAVKLRETNNNCQREAEYAAKSAHQEQKICKCEQDHVPNLVT